MKKIIIIISQIVLIASCASNQQKELTPEENKGELYYDLGTNELVKKNYLQALTNLLKAKEYSPKNSQIRNNLGMAYYFKGQPDLAISELKESLSLDAKNSDAKLNLATIYFEKKKIKDARVLYEELLTNLTFENQYRTYYNLALLDLYEGDRRGAFLNLDRAIKEKEDYCPAHYKLGELYSEEYKFKEALSSFRQSGKGVCVNEPAPYFKQAMTLVNLDRKSEAKKKFEELIARFPKSPLKNDSIRQLNQLAQKNISDEEGNLASERQTEVIHESPKF